MQAYKTDIHIHSLLSPCGDLSMSPANIIDNALSLGISIIGITDHNSTLQSVLIRDLGKEKGLLVLCGCELTSREEAHVLAFFGTEEDRVGFQSFLDTALPSVFNNVDKFGYQIVVNSDEEIVYEEPKLLISALPYSVEELYVIVKKYNGIFIPAHVDKPSYSLMSQYGFIPPDLKADALELSKFTSPTSFLKRFAYLKRFQFFQSSDAHIDTSLGKAYCYAWMEALNFQEFCLAVAGKNGRRIECVE